MRETERESDRDRDTEREGEGDRQTQREREGERETDRETKTETERVLYTFIIKISKHTRKKTKINFYSKKKIQQKECKQGCMSISTTPQNNTNMHNYV